MDKQEAEMKENGVKETSMQRHSYHHQPHVWQN
jgi:hypothetical protein